MLDRSWTRRIALAAIAGGVALALVAAPFAPGAALAKGASDNGVEHSDGRAGGNGHGSNGGSSGSAPGLVIGNSGVGGEDGPGNGHGLALGHDKDAVSGVDVGANGIHPANHGATSSMLGSLNAAHAIANGNTNDNLNSKVGQITAYMDLFNNYAERGVTTVGEVADALITASNKDLTSMELVDVESVVSGVNDLIDDNEEDLLTTAEEEDLLTTAEENVAAEIDSDLRD